MSKFINGFKRKSQSRIVFITILAVFLLVALNHFAAAQAEAAAEVINQIKVVIDGQPSPPEMVELIPIKAGDIFSLRKINSSIKQIYQSGIFSDIEVVRGGSPGINLTFFLTSRLTTRSIYILGKENIPRKRLKERIFILKEGGSYSEDKKKKAVEELQDALRDEGNFDARIEARAEKTSDGKQINVLFQILAAKEYRVERIDFKGDIILPPQGLKNVMTTSQGRKYVPAVLREDLEKIKELYIEEDYQRVEIQIKAQEFHDDRETVSLELDIKPNEKIEIEINGADVPLNLVKPIWETRIFEEWGLDEGEAKIKAFLRKKRYLFAEVSSYIERENNTIKIIYNVSPGERFGLEDIFFQGLNHYSAAQLKKRLAIEENIPLFGRVDGARLFEIPNEIEFLYKTQGFPDTRVELNFERTGNKVKPIFSVEEGRQEIIQSLTTEGAGLFSQERLFEEITCFQSGPFFQPTVQRDIEKLENFYMNEGVRSTEIRALVQNVGENLFAVSFQIREGVKVHIENIIVAGNNVTKRSTIQRELLLAVGDFARYDRIRETKRRLERLGIFTEVKIEEILLSPERENLLIRVREGDRNYVSLGLGMETKTEPRSFDIWNNVMRPRGTAELIRSNIMGTAAQISLVGQLSIKERRGVISWEQPYFFGLSMQTYLNAWLEQEERKSYSFDRRGISLSGIRSLSEKENLVLLTTLRFARTSLFKREISEPGVDRQHFPVSATSISSSVIWDKRSDPFNPESGYFLSTVLEWAYPLFNAESDFLKTFNKYQHYIPLFPKVTFVTTARLGLGRGKIPIHERFFAGGSNSFRGTRFDELGPKDPTSLKPIGGKALILLNFELTFPVFPRFKHLYGMIFYDKGSVFSKRSQVSLAGLQDAMGLGLRYRTPLGPVRIELGWNLDAAEKKGTPLVIFTIGNVF